MNWIRINKYHYVNEGQLRDIQFIRKGEDEYFYRIFYQNGQNVDIKGFDTLEDAFEHANKTFKINGEPVAAKELSKETPAPKPKEKKTK